MPAHWHASSCKPVVQFLGRTTDWPISRSNSAVQKSLCKSALAVEMVLVGMAPVGTARSLLIKSCAIFLAMFPTVCLAKRNSLSCRFTPF